MNLINIIIFLLILIPIIYFIYYFSKKNADTDIDNCQGDQCVQTINCSLLDPTTIKKCDSDKNICESCRCTSNPNVKQNCMNCTVVSDTNPYPVYLEKEKCIDPFQYNDAKKQCFLKPGSYCLPVKIPDIDCNPYTSDKVLNLNGNIYEWKCVCKNTSQFTGDFCDHIKVCGMDSTDNPSKNNERGLIKKESSNSHVFWTKESNWDPIKDSECLCPDEYANNELLACLPNTCSGGGKPGQTTDDCICDSEFINCADINKDTTTPNKGLCSMPSCIPDPCRNGKYNKETSTCDCNENNTKLIDSNSILGYSCQNPCNPDPCGDRGTCKVMTIDDDKIIWNIDQDESFNKSFLLKISKDTKDTQDLYLNSDFTLKENGSKFYFENPTHQDEQITNNNLYYIYYKDKDNKDNYIDFINRKIVSDKNTNMLIKFIHDDYCKDRNQFKLVNSNNLYISGKVDEHKQIYTNTKSHLGNAICDPCHSGYLQDGELRCNNTDPGSCGASGFILNPNIINNCNPGFNPEPFIGGSFFNPEIDCICKRSL